MTEDQEPYDADQAAPAAGMSPFLLSRVRRWADGQSEALLRAISGETRRLIAEHRLPEQHEMPLQQAISEAILVNLDALILAVNQEFGFPHAETQEERLAIAKEADKKRQKAIHKTALDLRRKLFHS